MKPMSLPLLFFMLLIGFIAAPLLARAEPAAEAGNSPDGSASVRFVNVHEGLEQFEVDPPGGFYFRFVHGPDSTLGVYKTAAGAGRDLPIRINRHNEETGLVLEGSVLFKAGYDGEFERVLRPGDAIIIPRCVPHGGIFGWDANEQTVLITTFVDKYAEYGPEYGPGGAPSEEFASKIRSQDGVSEDVFCSLDSGQRDISWSIQELRAKMPD